MPALTLTIADTTDDDEVQEAINILQGLNGGAVQMSVETTVTVTETDDDDDDDQTDVEGDDDDPGDVDIDEASAKQVAKKDKKSKKKKSKVTSKKEEETIDEDDDGKELDHETVRQAIKEYAKLEGRDAAIKLLHLNDAESISDLQPEKFESVMKKVAPVLKKAKK